MELSKMLEKVRNHYNKKGYKIMTNMDTITFCVEKVVDQIQVEIMEKELEQIPSIF